MDGQIGEKEIVKVLKKKYETHYNEFCVDNKDNIICKIYSGIKTDCCNNKCNIIHKTNVIDVKTGIDKLKNQI